MEHIVEHARAAEEVGRVRVTRAIESTGGVSRPVPVNAIEIKLRRKVDLSAGPNAASRGADRQSKRKCCRALAGCAGNSDGRESSVRGWARLKQYLSIGPFSLNHRLHTFRQSRET